jgi:hypothetical protein
MKRLATEQEGKFLAGKSFEMPLLRHLPNGVVWLRIVLVVVFAAVVLGTVLKIRGVSRVACEAERRQSLTVYEAAVTSCCARRIGGTGMARRPSHR